MKHFNMTQWRVLCPHNHLLKTTTSTTGDIRELSSLTLRHQFGGSKLSGQIGTGARRSVLKTVRTRTWTVLSRRIYILL